uniref:C2H2-type domain-containing protein n=1 Tax=Neogobius melanostomus TaxID=47308 RepID=A0A8C6URU8_9GOBI
MSKAQALRALVTERLTAAAEEIFTLFERTFAEYEEELCRSREEHPPWGRPEEHQWEHPSREEHLTWNHPRREEHQWDPPRREEHPPWTESTDTWTQHGAGVQLQCVKVEPEEQFRAVCAKTQDSSLLQHNGTEDDWEPFSCSAAQVDTAALNSGVPLQCVKEEPEEQFRAVCAKTEVSSLLQHNGAGDDWEPFTWSATQAEAPSSGGSELSAAPKHQCPVCLKAFGSKSHLHRHAIVHSGEKPFSCSLCSKRFNSKSYLIVHMRSHTGERPYSCPFCAKGFSHRSAFNFHVQTHSKERPFSCPVCAKRFTVPYYLKVHMKTHSGERPHSCSVCGSSFTQKSSLNMHMRTHSADRPVRCPVCAKGFTFKHNLDMHMRTHPGPAQADPAAAQSQCSEQEPFRGAVEESRLMFQ